jgi:hypothetical protein
VATYVVRNLHCLTCDQPVRARNLLIGESEVLSPCPECNNDLASIGGLDMAIPCEPVETLSQYIEHHLRTVYEARRDEFLKQEFGD